MTERQLTILAEGAIEIDDPRARAIIIALIREIRRFPPGAVCFKDLPEGARFRHPADDSPFAEEILCKIAPMNGGSFRPNTRGARNLLREIRNWELVIPVEATP
jgi:hypothetical protein